MEPTPFRKLDKQMIRAYLPTPLERRVREQAYLNRTSVSAVLTRLLAEPLGMDPSEFGLPANAPAA